MPAPRKRPRSKPPGPTPRNLADGRWWIHPHPTSNGHPIWPPTCPHTGAAHPADNTLHRTCFDCGMDYLLLEHGRYVKHPT